MASTSTTLVRRSDSSSALSFRAPIGSIRFERNEPSLADARSSLVAFACGNRVRLYDYRSKAYVDDDKIVYPQDSIVSCIAFMDFEGKLYLFAAADKLIKGWSLSSSQSNSPQTIESLSEFKASKRIGALLARDGVIVYGDKFGEVHTLPLNADGTFGNPTFLLSHVSIITDMILSPAGNLLLTADRDEKVRVSHYPKGYIIESYCLGHREFVSGLVIPSTYPDVLITGSGDGSLRVWSYKDGTELESHNHKTNENLTVAVPLSFSSKSSALAVLVIKMERNVDGSTKETERYVVLYSLTVNEQSKRPTLQERQRLNSEEGWVSSGAFDGDGRLWLVGSQTTTWLYPIALYEQREPGAANFYRKLEPNETSLLFTKLLCDASYVVEEKDQKAMWSVIAGVHHFKKEVNHEEKKSKKAKESADE